MIGTRLAHYEVVEKLGAGGMGVVYKARDLRLERFVALKILAADRVSDPSRKRGLMQEATAISALNHPNIVTIHNIENEGGLEFIVMEYVSGRTLDRLIPPGGLEPSEAIGYALQVADALGVTHAAGIIHRDLKPGNIMVTDSGQVKVLDFGLAKFDRLNGDRPDPDGTMTLGLTLPGTVIGTVAYMSPEQARGDPLDARSDIFSFGAVLYEMLTGERPFRGHHAAATLHQIHYQNPPLPSHRKAGIPPALDGAVIRALEKDRGQRYGSVGEMAKELRAVASERGTGQALGLPALTRITGSPKPGRRTFAISAMALLAVGLAGGGLVHWWPVLKTRLAPASAALPLRTPYDFDREGREVLYRYDRKGSINAAIASFQKAVALDANYAPGYAGLGVALWRKFREEKDRVWLEQARSNAERAVSLDSQLAYARVALGLVLVESGEEEEASRQLRQALVLDPENAEAHDGLARMAQQKAEWKTAKSEEREAVRLRPEDWYFRSQLGSIYNATGNYSEAEKTLLAGLAQTPDNFILHRQLSVVYHQQGQFAKSASELQKCLEIQPSANIYSNLGTLYFFQGLYPQAVASLEKAVKLGANDPLIWGNLGDAYRWTPDNGEKANQAYTRAVQLLRDHIAGKPGNPTLRSRMAVYLAQLSRGQEAKEELAWLEKLPSKDASLLFRMVLGYEILGLRAQALKTLDAALEAGYSLEEVKKDPELASLRKDEGYQHMLARRGL